MTRYNSAPAAHVFSSDKSIHSIRSAYIARTSPFIAMHTPLICIASAGALHAVRAQSFADSDFYSGELPADEEAQAVTAFTSSQLITSVELGICGTVKPWLSSLCMQGLRRPIR